MAYPFIRKIIHSEKLRLNDAKTRLAGPARRHQITGLVVNDTQAGIGRARLRELRSKINHICKLPMDKAPESDVAHIRGWLSFVKSVDEKRHSMLTEYIGRMHTRYPRSAVCLLPAK